MWSLKEHHLRLLVLQKKKKMICVLNINEDRIGEKIMLWTTLDYM